MHGYADFKSHVLRRDEKGVFGIPFKRLLFCALSGGGIMTLARVVMPAWSMQIGIGSFLLLLILTAPKGGIPRWQRLALTFRWRVRCAAALAPQSLLSSVGRAFQLPDRPIDIDADLVFSVEESASQTELADWVLSAQLADDERGALQFNPELA